MCGCAARTHAIRTGNAHEFIKPSRAPPCRSSLVSDTSVPARCGRRLKTESSRFRVINYFPPLSTSKTMYLLSRDDPSTFSSPWKSTRIIGRRHNSAFDIDISSDDEFSALGVRVDEFFAPPICTINTDLYILISKDFRRPVIDDP